MKKLLLIFLAMGLFFSCGEKEQVELDSAKDLSARGTANCYILYREGEYFFDGTIKGNGKRTEGITVPLGIPISGVKLVWETSIGMIDNLSFDGINIHFTFDGTAGNALIAATDENAEIVWSWHIWAPAERLETMESKSGYQVSNLNIGALKSELAGSQNADTYGMLFQWGRKDPFPSSPTLTGDVSTMGFTVYDALGEPLAFEHSSWTSDEENTLDFAISHPTICISNYAHYSSTRDWLKEDETKSMLWAEQKTIFDPCPAGYKVPNADTFKSFTTSGGYSTNVDDFDVADTNADGVIDACDFTFGWHFNMKSESLFFPAAARYDGFYGMLMGSKAGLWGTYWANSSAPENSSYYAGTAAVALSFMTEKTSIAVSPSAFASKADAYSVRCVKE